MKTISVSHELKTGEIKVLGNLTRATASANRISCFSAVKGKNINDSASIHIDFQIKPDREQLPSVIGETEELDLVLSVDDAMQIGILLELIRKENLKREKRDLIRR